MAELKKQVVLSSPLNCSICQKVYQEPRLLSCGHTFCLKCLPRLKSKGRSKSSQSLTCSLCESSWPISDDEFDSIAKDFIVSDFISSLPCVIECGEADVDESEHGAIAGFCIDCWELLCDVCVGLHKKVKATRYHVVKKITEMSKDDIRSHLKNMTSQCLTHKGQQITLFCVDCNDAACCNCITDSHNEHNCINIEDVDKDFIAQITSSLDILKAKCDQHDIDLQAAKNYMPLFEKQNKEMDNNISLLISEFKDNLKLTYEKIVESLEGHNEKILKANLERNSATKVELKKIEEQKERLIIDTRNNIMIKEKLLNSTSTAVERFKHIKDESSAPEAFSSKTSCELETNKEHLEMFVSLWKTDFIKLSNCVLESQNNFIAWSRTVLEALANENSAITPLYDFNAKSYLTNSKEDMNDKNVFAIKEYSKTCDSGFSLSMHDDKLLIAKLNSTELYLYSADGDYLSTVWSPYEWSPKPLIFAAWTPQGNICTVVIEKSGWDRLTDEYVIVLMTPSGGKILEENTLQFAHKHTMLFNIVSDHFFCATGYGLYNSTDGATWQINEAFNDKNVLKVVRAVGDRCELFWTIENDEKILHLYSLHVTKNELHEHLIHTPPQGLGLKKRDAYEYDMAYDDRMYIFKSNFTMNAVHMFSITGHYLRELFLLKDEIQRPFALAVDKKCKRLFVGHSCNHVTSISYS